MTGVGQVLDSAWASLVSFFELGGFSRTEMISVFIIVVVGVIGGKVFSELISRVLEMSGADELAVKLDIQKFLRGVGYHGEFSKFVADLLKYFIYFIVFLAVFNVLGVESFMDYLQMIVGFLPNLALAFAIFFAGFVFFSHIEDLIIGFYRQEGILDVIDEMDPIIPSYKVAARFIKIFGIAVTLVIVSAVLGVNEVVLYIVTGGLVLTFVVIFGVSFYDVLRNLGVSLYLQHVHNFVTGREIKVDGVSGELVYITPVYTKIKTGKSYEYVPNTVLLKKILKYEE